MIRTNEIKFLLLCSGFVIIMLLVAIAFVGGQPGIGFMIGTFGTAAWVLGFFVYVVVVDSRRHWPDASTAQRTRNILNPTTRFTD